MILLRDLFIVNMVILGFAFMFNVPLKLIPRAGLCGSVGWIVYLLTLSMTESVTISTFTGTLMISLLGDYFTTIDRKPLTVFIVPGILPFVPGFGIYNTMFAVVEQDYAMALQHGTNTFFAGLAIALALTVMLSINNYRKTKKAAKNLPDGPEVLAQALETKDNETI